MHQWFFTRPKWIAFGSMTSGAVSTAYGLFTCIRYAQSGQSVSPIFGTVPMAFPTAALFVIDGLAIFWIGWLIRTQNFSKARNYPRLSENHKVQLILAAISAISLILVALIGSFK